MPWGSADVEQELRKDLKEEKEKSGKLEKQVKMLKAQNKKLKEQLKSASK